MATQFVSKLTVKNLGFNGPAIRALLSPLVLARDKAILAARESNNQGEITKLEQTPITVNLAKIVGKSTSTKPYQSAYGEGFKFVGEFLAINQQTGEMVSSSQAILPEYIAKPLGEALKESSSVEFAIMVTVSHSDREGGTGYQFGVVSLMETKITSGMAALLALAGEDVAKLAAPTPAATPAAAPTEPPAPAPAPAEPPANGGRKDKSK